MRSLPLLLLLAACEPEHHAVPLKAPNNELILGEYERHPPDGTTAIRFRGDGSVKLAKTRAELDGSSPIATGTWKTDGNKLTLTYEQGACTGSDGEKAGTYEVVISRVGIHFKKLEDACERRSQIDNQTWWRVH
ncbi:MAG TPA: hypothetical protein VGC42_08345 [Kofleriaceae bacterium]